MSLETLDLSFYIGTYTNGESKGIYKCNFDTTTGKFSNLELAAETDNPTYLYINKNNTYLYSVLKSDEHGGTAAFSIDPQSGRLILLNCQLSKGKPPCHINMDSKNNYVFSGNYHQGKLEVFPVNTDGTLAAPSSIITHAGSQSSHIHYTALNQDEKFLFAVDLGLDKVFVYHFDRGILIKHYDISLPKNSGPRHMVFHPNSKYAYIITEYSSEVIVLENYGYKAGFKPKQYISTLPYGFMGKNSGAAIKISFDGRYLYASNRGHDSIAVFSVDDNTGRLELVSLTSTSGSGPRDFSLDPTGSYLLAANQETNNVVSFKIDKFTGKLHNLIDSLQVPNPVCIKFLNV